MLANGALDMLKDDEKTYRSDLRNIFLSQVTKHSNRQHKYQLPSYETSQHLKDFSGTVSTQLNQELGSAIEEKQRRYQMDQAISSGGDADRYFHDAAQASAYSGDSCLYRNDQSPSLRHSHCNNNKSQALTMPNKVATGVGKYQQKTTPLAIPVDEYVGDHHRYLCETVSNVGSEGSSVKSQKSSKTVVSRKSSHDLKKLVKSKCKFQEAIDETMQQMCNPDYLDQSQNDVRNMLYDRSTMQLDTLPLSHCKHCTDKMHPSQSSQKDVTTEIGKTDFADSRNGDTLTISVDDVVNSKVINPMIRKLQRMYLNNLKEEMSLMEDLERLPHEVNEVYKATIFKQQRE